MEVNRLVFKNFNLKQYPSCVMVLLKTNHMVWWFPCLKECQHTVNLYQFWKILSEVELQTSNDFIVEWPSPSKLFYLAKNSPIEQDAHTSDVVGNGSIFNPPASKYRQSLYLPFRKVLTKRERYMRKQLSPYRYNLRIQVFRIRRLERS